MNSPNSQMKSRQKAKRKYANRPNEKPPKSKMKTRQKAKRCFKFILFDAKLSEATNSCGFVNIDWCFIKRILTNI